MTSRFDSDTRTLLVSGFVDETSGPALREAITEHSERYTSDVVIDLNDVDFLPSLGIGVLAVAMRTAEEAGATIELLAAQGTISQQVLAICGLPHRTS